MKLPVPFDLETLLRVPFVDPDLGFDISPDGNLVSYSCNKTGRWEIYIQNIQEDSVTQQISGGEGSKFSPNWSPDGKRLAYVVDFDGGENFDILLFDLDSRDHKNITSDTPFAITSSLAWSPDGKNIAFCADRDGRFDTYVIPSLGGEYLKVLDQSYPDWEVFWSPDGRWLAVVSEGPGQDYWTTIVPVDGGESRPISLDGKPISAKDACWSPDSKKLAFASNHSGTYEIGLLEIDSGKIVWVTGGEGEKEHPDFSPDGKTLTYVLSLGPKTQLAVHELGIEKPDLFQIEPGVIYSPTFMPDGKGILFVFDSPRHPDDLWKFSLSDQSFTQITHSLPAEIDQNNLVTPEEIHYPGLDNALVPALLYCPIDAGEDAPAVVYIHGGPNWLTQVTWDPLIQHMVSRGWVVLAPNYRGSTGYGKEWQLASRFDLGGVDNDDVFAGAEYLEREKIAHPAKIAVTGRSWGGYLTMTNLTTHPNRWAAGAAVVPFLNWFTGHKNSREDLQHWDIENFGRPEENAEMWRERSPFFFLDMIEAPVQLICGAHDVRCPASESKQAYDELTNLGKICDYVLYPDEGHSFLKIENLVDAKKRRVEFLAKFLEN